jgi:hypothetical protein
VIAQQPQLARQRDWIDRRLRDDVLAGETVALVERRQQPVQVLALEAGEVQIEAGGVQRVQFGRQKFVIPARVSVPDEFSLIVPIENSLIGV